MDKKKLRKQADNLWAQVILKQHPKCEVCGKKATQAHHFYYRGSYGHLRYDLENGIGLCQPCHFILHHQDPKKIEDQIVEKRGQKWLKQLQKKAHQNPQSYQTTKWYQDNIEKLEKE